ncbi:hypothetical protein, conserved [Eimeria tenella]|nr:hypothetical protein, conserved [Eimeria tenella]
MELQLASTRNAFLKSEIALDILSAFFGFVAAAAGLFGMNIKSGLENEERVFWAAAAAAAAAAVALLLAVYWWFQRQKL